MLLNTFIAARATGAVYNGNAVDKVSPCGSLDLPMLRAEHSGINGYGLSHVHVRRAL